MPQTMTNRNCLIQDLADISGPLGPFESFEHGERHRDKWLAQLDATDIDGLLSILSDRPDPNAFGSASWADVELNLGEALASACRHDLRRLITRVGPMLGLEPARPTVIDVMGATSLQECIPW